MSPARPLGVMLVALLVAACGVISTTPPAPTPADMGGIATELAKRGVVLDHLVSGDAGCADHTLAQTAIAFDASGLDQTTPIRVRVYIFGNRASFEKLRGSVDECARAFVTDPGTYETIEQSPFVVAGQGPWTAGFEAALRAGLEAAAGSGN